MKISVEEVRHVANLARLSFDGEAEEKLGRELADIIAFADKLGDLDTDGVEPSAHAVSVQNVFREDVVQPSFDRDKLLENAPSAQDGCYLVPKVVE